MAQSYPLACEKSLLNEYQASAIIRGKSSSDMPWIGFATAGLLECSSPLAGGDASVLYPRGHTQSRFWACLRLRKQAEIMS